MCGHLGVLALVLLAVSPVAADDLAPAKEGSPPTRSTPRGGPVGPDNLTYTHEGMFQASLRVALGYRTIVPYSKGNYCGDTDNSTASGNAAVCTGRAPFAFDLELGYGVARKIDLVAEFRLGVEGDFDSFAGTGKTGPNVFHVSPGARFFFSDAKTTKLFTTAQVVFDFTGYEEAGGKSRGNDIGVRNLSGVWLDLERGYGFYAFVGETMTFSRWWRFELEAGIGVQARYR